MFVDPRRRARWAATALYAYLVATLASLAAGLVQLQLLWRVRSNAFGSQLEMLQAVEASDARIQIIAWSVMAVFVLAGIVCLVWTYRVAANAAVLGEGKPEFSPGWAVGWYFVPFANFVKPYHAMVEIWARSAWPQTLRLPTILGWWWFFWIGSNIVDQVLIRTVGHIEGLPGLILWTGGDVASDFASAILILIYIRLIHRLTAMQVAKYAARDSYAALVELDDGSTVAVPRLA